MTLLITNGNFNPLNEGTIINAFRHKAIASSQNREFLEFTVGIKINKNKSVYKNQ
jgi:hypothetical protein